MRKPKYFSEQIYNFNPDTAERMASQLQIISHEPKGRIHKPTKPRHNYRWKQISLCREVLKRIPHDSEDAYIIGQDIANHLKEIKKRDCRKRKTTSHIRQMQKDRHLRLPTKAPHFPEGALMLKKYHDE